MASLPRRSYPPGSETESPLVARVQAIQARAGSSPKPPTTDKNVTTVTQLKLWPVPTNTIPNTVLRGALFSVAKLRPRYDKMAPIASVTGVEVRFMGERFNQTDLDVWEALVQVARDQPFGSEIRFNVKTLLRTLGRQNGKTQRDQLHDEIMRLCAGTVQIEWLNTDIEFFGHLINGGLRDKKTGEYVVQLHPKLLEMYAMGYTYIDPVQRTALGSSNLARWLHAFYSSHAKPHAYKVATLRELCGSERDLRFFRADLKKTLDMLKEVEAIDDWQIDQGDKVVIQKTPRRRMVR